MKKFATIKLLHILALTVLMGLATTAFADEMTAKHKLVIQVSSADSTTQTLALNTAANVQKKYGMDNIAVELVAYGPGVSIMTKKSPLSKRVKSLAMQNITFSACGTTLKAIKKKTGKKPPLTEGVKVVPGGIVRIMTLEEKGYSYVRP